MIADRMRMIKVESGSGINYLYDEGTGENDWVEGYIQSSYWDYISKEETYIKIYCFNSAAP